MGVSIFDLAGTHAKIKHLEEQTRAPDLWEDRERAQKLFQEVAFLRDAADPWVSALEQARELRDLASLAEQEQDEALTAELADELERLAKRVSELKIAALLSGEHDRCDAILDIHAGAGGTDAQDWVESLARMYARWGSAHNLAVDQVDRTPGEEAGSISTTLLVKGPYAYGYLKAERGVHRLVRISPFDANRRRHTSFASVDVIPDLGEANPVVLAAEDLKIETFRSQGAGGQHVNKTDSAVRITHLPTGSVVQCQDERSQHRNRETAMKVLRARLAALEQRKQEEKLAQLRGEQRPISWGSQIRSYVLHPYTMVKDHRTQVQTADIQAVLAGSLDEFILAFLSASAAQAKTQPKESRHASPPRPE